jgi:colanic acid/amylovoran biosynthesis glycosyltransferase
MTPLQRGSPVATDRGQVTAAIAKVVHSTPFWLRQTQTWIHTQVDCTPSNRIESHVVCESVINLEQFPVQHLHRFADAPTLERLYDRSLRKLGLRRHLGYLARVARQVGAGVIHSHFGDVGWANIGAARAARTKHVVTFYGYDMSFLPRQPLWRDRFDELFGNVDLVLCEGPHMARCIADIGCPEHKIRVQHLGIRLERIPFHPRRWQPGEKLRVLISGIFTEKKGIPYALEALGQVQKQQDLEITIIGDAHDHPETQREKTRIVHAIGKHGLGSSVRMLGFQPHAVLMHEAYAHHIFMSPSITAQNGATEGGAPVSIIEMAASGMIVVSSKHCDIPNVIQDRQTGFLADERDAPGLIRCLDEVISYPAQWERMVELGRRRIEIEFDARIQGSKLADVYNSTLA